LKVLISIISTEELSAAIKGKADIIDIKNPEEGSLGAACPLLIKQIRILAPNYLISVAIGDMPNLPCTAALAAMGVAMFNIDYIKIGLYGIHSYNEALKLLTNVVNSIREYNSEILIVGAGYGDAKNFGGVNPLKIPKIVKNAGANIAMLDTINKKDKTLFDFLEHAQLKMFVKEAHNLGLLAALAGSLQKDDLSTLYELGTDITGFRGAICNNNDRKNGVVSETKVADIMKFVHNLI
jgi:uncharacterized protein (UPF0264 family)